MIGKARKLLFEASCVQRDIDLYRNVQLGDAAFGVGPFPAATVMPLVLSELRRLHPKVCLRVEESNWKLLLERLRTEDIEFFLSDTSELPDDGTLEVRRLADEEIHFHVRASHPLATRACTFGEAWHYGLVSARAPLPLKSQLGARLGLPADQMPVLALECDNFAIVKAVALSTDAVLAATNALVQADVTAAELVPLRVKDAPALRTRMGIVSLLNRTPSPMAQVAIACIERIAGEIYGPAPSTGKGK
jgi:DNA-binding transcriptional LysR family regulator